MGEVSQEQAIEQVFNFAVSLKRQGKSDAEIKSALIEKGLNEKLSQSVIDNLDSYNSNTRSHASYSQEKESGGMGWLLWVIILVVVNVLSAAFDWGFWIY